VGEVAGGLKVSRLSVRTVNDINFDLAPGQCAGLTGPSGAGKTLLLRALADLDPHNGEMWLDGVAAEAMPVHRWRRQVGLLPAESAWWHDHVKPHFSDVHEPWLTSLGFGPEVLQWQISRLSSGERQRLALLRLLMLKPKVLLLDEPTANLDGENTARAERLLNAYRLERRAVIVWVGHDLEQIKRNCGPIYAIQDGRFKQLHTGGIRAGGGP
jgi:ABC-type iron transport system FetAB ATPase subunit